MDDDRTARRWLASGTGSITRNLAIAVVALVVVGLGIGWAVAWLAS